MENLLFSGWQNSISFEGDWFRLWSLGGYCSIYSSNLPDKTILVFKRPPWCNWLFCHQLPKSGAHVIKILKKWKWKSLSRVRLLWPRGLYSPWNSSGQNAGVGSLSLLQAIFLTQGLNPGLLHCRWILYQLRHKESPRILEWAACPFSRGSSRPRNLTGVSCLAGRSFTNWASREAD